MKTLQQLRKELPNISFNDTFRYLNSIDNIVDISGLKPIKVAILRSFSVEMIEPVLKFRLFLEGYNPKILIGDYNNYFQEILNESSSLYNFKPDIILIMVRMEELLPDFIHEFGKKTFSEWKKVIQSMIRNLESLVDKIEGKLQSQVIFQNMTLSGDSYWGIYDTQNPEGQSYLLHEFNQLLTKVSKNKQSMYIWDYDKFLQKMGYENIYDPKNWYLSRNPFKQSTYPHIVNDLFKYVLSIIGKIKKCIVLDLDNTLWGGIAGEDGIDGVALGHDYPGSCYCDFQKELLKLYHRGIILAINSKNNEEDALDIIDNHPNMVLRRKHFASMYINWNNKVSNIQSIAQDLNIGINSMIFIDDSPMECALVSDRLPECDVMRLPEKIYLIPSVVKKMSGIENIRITAEDKKKGEMYKAQVARKQSEKSFNNLDDFLKNLNIEVIIEPATNFSIPRIAQLTQKTNQMNLTTRRYTETDIQSFVNHPDSFVFSVASKDRFGDNGIVGVFILKIANEECLIDTFLLSCRVIARSIENVMIAFIADFALKIGIRTLIGEYIPTAKNKPAVDMYEKFQFKRISDILFRADLKLQKFEYPSYIKNTIQD